MKESAIPTHDSETSTSSWDGAAVVAAIPSTATESDLKSIFAWEDSDGEPDAKASYKFPHHNGTDGPANLTACSAGIAALNGGRGGADIPAEDRQGVWEHLAKHLEDGGAEEVPELADAEPADAEPAEADGDAMAELKSHLDAALKIVADMGGDAEPKPDAKKPPAFPPKKPGEEVPPTEAFDPKDRKAMEALAAAMIADPNFAASVAKVVEDLAPREVEGAFVPLMERAILDDGTATLRVIVPGWGSSGYYSPEVLERDGPKVFPAGTKMFWNHQTDAEEDARPEGDLRDLAGELVEDATWDPAGPEGAGLYANAKVFAGFRDVVEELAPHIGVSIRAMGKASVGTAEGREGTVVDALTHGRSVDFVTAPGAGGKVLSLFEAAGRKGEQMDAKELREAQDAAKAAQEELAKRVAADTARDAADVAREALTASKLPEAAVTKLTESLATSIPTDDEGALDREAFEQVVTEAIAAEVAYLTEVTGAGSVRGLGGGDAGDEANEGELAEAFQAIGLPESTAKIAATGRE